MKAAQRWRATLVLILFAAGCNNPTAADRDNRRVVDEILTAITLKNVRLLEEAAKRAAARRDTGQFADDNYQDLKACIDKARGGDWQGAETDAYEFRRLHPFVKEGQ